MIKNLRFLLLSIFFLSFLNSKLTLANEITNTNEIVRDKNGNVLTDKDLKIHNIVKNTPNYTPTTFIPKTTTSTTEFLNILAQKKETIFENGDTYLITRFNFKEDSKNRFNTEVYIPGNTITVRYIDPETNKWVNTSNLKNLKYTTLFIDTDTHSMVLGVPAVYSTDFTNKTLTALKTFEQTPIIEKGNNNFKITLSFFQNKNAIGEFWYILSNKRLVDWSKKESFDELFTHDLSNNRRWSFDGYYFKTPTNYVPSGENVFYNHPSNYTGASWTKYGKNPLAKNMGYIMTETCMQNQNEQGFWQTGPKSLWLETDFNIGSNFYDTRFNTDFAFNLLNAYQQYNNPSFLESALKYAEFFIEHAKTNSYLVNGGGILVADYASFDNNAEKTHVSLNHQLTEMNFLYQLYLITNEKSYLNLANEMLLGIENTKESWVLPDKNLNYALMYNKTTNKMVDYPYLTYNDLYQTKELIKLVFNTNNETIDYLLKNKKIWMDANNITGYIDYVKPVTITEDIVS